MSNEALALCRVCLASNINMYYIANTRYQEIFEKLSTQLCTADRRPETVCYICFSHLQRCRRFMNMSRTAEATLTRISLSGNQTTPENVYELNQTMLPLAATPVQNLFSGDTYNSSHATVNRQVIFVDEEAAMDPFAEIETNTLIPSEMVTVKIEVVSDHEADNAFNESTMDVQTIQPDLQTSSHEDMKLSHTKQGPYSCYRCNKQFNKKSSLTRHMKLHTGKLFVCDVCNRQFCKRTDHTRHMRVHAGEKPYYCDICDRQFLGRTDHTRHMRIHTGERPFACDICDKQFCKKSDQLRHMRVHTGEKPYTCDICDRHFNQNGDLTRHMRVHTGDKPHACDLCDKKFNQKHSLTIHMAVHTGVKPYACNVCEKKFNRRSVLKIHMRVHHGDNPM